MLEQRLRYGLDRLQTFGFRRRGCEKSDRRTELAYTMHE